MITGALLLARARAMKPTELAETFDRGPDADRDRAAVLAFLLSGFGPDDAPLIRELTSFEASAVAAQPGGGCGDALYACCWLLFALGDVADSALVWQAKNLNFDCACLIDSVFLVPRGVPATVAFARAQGIPDLAEWVAETWAGEPVDEIEGWRESDYFTGGPPASASGDELAQWLRS